MHIRQIRIKNIKSIRELTWDMPAEKPTGWHVVLGDNGSGKSTLLKSVAVALLGPRESYGLREPWDAWLREGCASGEIRLQIDWNSNWDRFVSKGNTPSAAAPLSLGLKLERTEDKLKSLSFEALKSNTDPNRHVWIRAGYGPAASS